MYRLGESQVPIRYISLPITWNLERQSEELYYRVLYLLSSKFISTGILTHASLAGFIVGNPSSPRDWWSWWAPADLSGISCNLYSKGSSLIHIQGPLFVPGSMDDIKKNMDDVLESLIVPHLNWSTCSGLQITSIGWWLSSGRGFNTKMFPLSKHIHRTSIRSFKTGWSCSYTYQVSKSLMTSLVGKEIYRLLVVQRMHLTLLHCASEICVWRCTLHTLVKHLCITLEVLF